ncbi:hypothetical protein [Cyclobacterium xiamenense]|uniref:hypothetical protein n=1 Tax=Cyclobacterium xiamenense TaxID=1297121 RepID=UPI0035D03B2E
MSLVCYCLNLCHLLMISAQFLGQIFGDGMNWFPDLNGRIQSELEEQTAIVFLGEYRAIGSLQSQGLHGGILMDAIRFLTENSGFDGLKELTIDQHGYPVWEGEAVDKVRGVSSVQVPGALPLSHSGSRSSGGGAIGVNGIQANGERKWQDAPTDTFAAWVQKNNYLFTILEWNRVLVRLRLDRSVRVITHPISHQFVAKIRKVFSDSGENRTELQQ